MSSQRKDQKSSCPEGWLKAGRRIEVHLTNKQERYARRAVGIARAVKNTLVATHQLARAHGEGYWPTPNDLEKLFNELKHDPEFGMLFANDVSKFVAQGACRDFKRAYQNWLNPELKARKPKLEKKRRTGSGSFLIASGIKPIQCNGSNRIKVPGLGAIKLKTRELPKGVIPYEVRIVRANSRWYAAVNYWMPPKPAEVKTHDYGGADMGINPLTVDSEHVHYQNPKALRKYLKKLAKWQRIQDRRTVGSSGWWEAQHKIDKIYRRIKGLRDNAHHQVSRELVHKYAVLGIETLNVQGMDQLKGQALNIKDAAIGGLLLKIKYKAQWYGTEIVAASRRFPSSKLCSVCGEVNQNLKRERHWVCICGAEHDRNENAADNLEHLAREAVGKPKFALGAVGANVTLPEGPALAGNNHVAGATSPSEGGRYRRQNREIQLELIS